jgi:hypothetical protein
MALPQTRAISLVLSGSRHHGRMPITPATILTNMSISQEWREQALMQMLGGVKLLWKLEVR